MSTVVGQQTAAGEAVAAEASELGSTPGGPAPGSPASTRCDALAQGSEVREVLARARLVAADGCCSDHEVADARDGLDVLADDAGGYAHS